MKEPRHTSYALWIGVAIFAIIAVIFSVNSSREPVPTSISDKPTKSDTLNSLGTVPSFALADYNGRTVSLSDFDKAEVFVINSWAVWCPFCKDELADFAALQEEFGERIAVIAIDRQEPLATVKGFTDAIGITDTMTFLIDPTDSFYRSIGGFSMPETIFADANGEIRIHKRGPMRIPEMREKVLSIINLQ
ncbi:MAG: hypothetical protein COW88_01400 [Candidatus Lloydbacteria bacterium CG22_combo_CG10-13_8_21_14_all_47_15]|uniref:Thioredoxin domain-containing protein n=1 Tax=Candidatus Lloydbacteria bacterium CG22_combo_CG10-13_8_21_14_all_47_15 TaxID=1974635 RepID=A0A2H0CUN4_9BACT|nr:MAG: hypothetical protein COW88_01400 [Candidatus Lloydbacteria bacterium CG22_combo_CG10-13_8_21_14_all_47_15]